MSDGRRRMMEYVCQQRITLHLALYGGGVGIILDLLALLVVEPGTASYVVALINLPGLIIVTGLAGYLLRKCTEYT